MVPIGKPGPTGQSLAKERVAPARGRSQHRGRRSTSRFHPAVLARSLVGWPSPGRAWLVTTVVFLGQALGRGEPPHGWHLIPAPCGPSAERRREPVGAG